VPAGSFPTTRTQPPRSRRTAHPRPSQVPAGIIRRIRMPARRIAQPRALPIRRRTVNVRHHRRNRAPQLGPPTIQGVQRTPLPTRGPTALPHRIRTTPAVASRRPMPAEAAPINPERIGTAAVRRPGPPAAAGTPTQGHRSEVYYDLLWRTGEHPRCGVRLTSDEQHFIAEIVPRELAKFPRVRASPQT
jgi:hypothetical protein